MSSRIVNYINIIYRLLIAGLFFWLYLLKGFIFYGLIESFATLFKVIKLIIEDRDGEPVARLYKQNSVLFRGFGIHSLFISAYFSIILSILFLLNYIKIESSDLAVLVLLYMLFIGIVIFTYFIYNFAIYEYDIKKSFFGSLLQVVKNIFTTIAIISIVIFSFWICRVNIIAMIFVVPMVYSLGVIILCRSRKMQF